MDKILSQFAAFKRELESSSPDLQKCTEMLTALKIGMTQFSFLVPSAALSPIAVKEVILAREILEHAILLAVKKHDIESFERQVAQVKAYYFDTGRFKDIPPSTLQYQILGLNLLRLLAQNRIAEFHTELELLPLDKHENVYIKHPIQLEQYIMEGAYNKVFSAAKDLPAPSYAVFMEMLMETRLREEIAECSEKSYTELPVGEAQKLLNFRTTQQLHEYAKERGWEVDGDRVLLQKKGQDSTVSIPSMNVINQTLAYAKELERIV
jgi:26S proteasome regulatory subunit N12